MSIFKRIIRFLLPYWIPALAAPLLMTIEVITELLQPRIVQNIIDVGVANSDVSVVIHAIILMVVLSFIGMFAGVGGAVFAIRAAMFMGADIRATLFRKIQKLSFGDLDRLETGQLVIRLTNDVTQVQDAVFFSIHIMIRGGMTLVGSVVMAFITSPSLAIIFFFLGPMIAIFLILVIKRTIRIFTRVQERLDRLNTVIVENFTGMRLVKSFVRRVYEKTKFGRINEVLESSPEIQETLRPVIDLKTRGRLCFENVTLSYNSGKTSHTPVLKNISFIAEPGETVAIVGATGSGKTSLINLIPRFYDVTKGRITVDNIDVKDLGIETLRKNIGIAMQNALLFSGTIRDNIRYGKPDATDNEIITAARAAQAHDFITLFPAGYDTPIEQRGVNLSDGQKQRIAIARALLIDPAILILDDSTSAVDVETEGLIQEALSRLTEKSTCFIVAQRISTILNADRIIVLDNGMIAAEGNHDTLLDTSPIYREIYDSQLGI